MKHSKRLKKKLKDYLRPKMIGIKLTKENLNLINHFILFEINKNIIHLEQWENKGLRFRFNNSEHSKRYKSNIKALLKVKKISDFYFEIEEILRKQKNKGK